jgi:hypothetical protein
MTPRAENQARNLVSSIPWGDRTRLLPKATAYAFSLDVLVRRDGPYLSIEKPYQFEEGLRHLFGQPMVEMPGGLHCEVPTGRIISANGEVGEARNKESTWFELRLQAGIGALEPLGEKGEPNPSPVSQYATTLSFSCTGVLELAGGPVAYRLSPGDLSGSAFLASIQESTTGTYRWLERRQLFGIGRVKRWSPKPEAMLPAGTAPNGGLLHFSFDLYGAE